MDTNFLIAYGQTTLFLNRYNKRNLSVWFIYCANEAWSSYMGDSFYNQLNFEVRRQNI